MQNDTLRVKKLTIIGLAAVLVAILAIGFAFVGPRPDPLKGAPAPVPASSDVPVGQVSGDENSNTTVVPDESSVPTYSNIDTLTYTNSFTTVQVDALQYGFYQFAERENLNIRDLVIDTATAKDTSTANSTSTGVQSTEVNISFKDKRYKAKIYKRSIGTIRLYMHDSVSDRELFDSRDINGIRL